MNRIMDRKNSLWPERYMERHAHKMDENRNPEFQSELKKPSMWWKL